MKKINSITDVIDFLKGSDDSTIYNIMESYENYRRTPDDDVFTCVCAIPELDHIHKRVKLEGYKFVSVTNSESLKNSDQKIIYNYLISHLKELLEDIIEDNKNKIKYKKSRH